MFGRVMVAVGALASLGLLAVGLAGYRGLPDGVEGPALRQHVLLGLAAVLVFVLAHAWVAFYLVGAARVLGEAAVARTLPPLLLAVAAALATFVLGSAVHSGLAPAGLHGALLWLTLLLQGWAGWAEWRAVTAAARATRTLAA